MRLAVLLLYLAANLLTACGSPPDDTESFPVDSVLVDALVEWHLATARETLMQSSIDSLKTDALAQMGFDSTGLSRRVRELADNPDKASAVYEAVGNRLREDRRPR